MTSSPFGEDRTRLVVSSARSSRISRIAPWQLDSGIADPYLIALTWRDRDRAHERQDLQHLLPHSSSVPQSARQCLPTSALQLRLCSFRLCAFPFVSFPFRHRSPWLVADHRVMQSYVIIYPTQPGLFSEHPPRLVAFRSFLPSLSVHPKQMRRNSSIERSSRCLVLLR